MHCLTNFVPTLRGSRGSDYRLHSAFDLYGFSWRTAEITTNKAGEKPERHQVVPGDISIADKAYSSRSGMEHVRENGGDFILRYRAKGFKLYDKDGQSLELLPCLQGLQARESTHVDCYYRHNSGQLRPVRLVAMKKDAAAEEASQRKKQYKVRNRQNAPIPQETMELHSCILLATSLHWTDAQILELYRDRAGILPAEGPLRLWGGPFQEPGFGKGMVLRKTLVGGAV